MIIKNKTVEKWSIFEVELEAQKEFERPFEEVEIFAMFRGKKGQKKVYGFYDGGSTWKIRFMPEETGHYTFEISSNYSCFAGIKGSFECIEASAANHGPVRVNKKQHFSYADGTPFFVLGTTAYAWTYASQELRKKTLESLKKFNFNKVRMAFFPKKLVGMEGIDISKEPPVYPFEGKKGSFDFRSFNVEYFRNFEDRVRELMELGIQADVILFHFYDFGQWGINPGMKIEDDLFFIKYLVARIAAFRNVWWCLANEYDLVLESIGKGYKVESVPDRKQWDVLGTYLMKMDPYDHPRSIHNWNWGEILNREWITHIGYQNGNSYELLAALKAKTGKPVICEECGYEGNVPHGWGNLSGEAELYKCWKAVMAGGYATHGECYIIDGNITDIFWTYGGTLKGQSPPRLKFMRYIMETIPFQEMEPDYAILNGDTGYCLRKGTEYYLFFFRDSGRKWMMIGLADGISEPEGTMYEVTLYDVWNCTILDNKTVPRGAYNTQVNDWTVMRFIKKA